MNVESLTCQNNVGQLLEDPLSITAGWVSESNSLWPKLYISDISDYLKRKGMNK